MEAEGLPSFTEEVEIGEFHRFLPAGPVASGEPPALDGHRRVPWIQIYQDHILFRNKKTNAQSVVTATLRTFSLDDVVGCG